MVPEILLLSHPHVRLRYWISDKMISLALVLIVDEENQNHDNKETLRSNQHETSNAPGVKNKSNATTSPHNNKHRQPHGRGKTVRILRALSLPLGNQITEESTFAERIPLYTSVDLDDKSTITRIDEQQQALSTQIHPGCSLHLELLFASNANGSFSLAVTAVDDGGIGNARAERRGSRLATTYLFRGFGTRFGGPVSLLSPPTCSADEGVSSTRSTAKDTRLACLLDAAAPIKFPNKHRAAWESGRGQEHDALKTFVDVDKADPSINLYQGQQGGPGGRGNSDHEQRETCTVGHELQEERKMLMQPPQIITVDEKEVLLGRGGHTTRCPSRTVVIETMNMTSAKPSSRSQHTQGDCPKQQFDCTFTVVPHHLGTEALDAIRHGCAIALVFRVSSSSSTSNNTSATARSEGAGTARVLTVWHDDALLQWLGEAGARLSWGFLVEQASAMDLLSQTLVAHLKLPHLEVVQTADAANSKASKNSSSGATTNYGIQAVEEDVTKKLLDVLTAKDIGCNAPKPNGEHSSLGFLEKFDASVVTDLLLDDPELRRSAVIQERCAALIE
ncbi:unnamed protein product [Amoebophrya sp. A25]|nr:unnamed protein product [Amoebophrya sp. A25]|eukprot:GSA25T00005261001.1